MSWLCSIGFHDWHQERPLTPYDAWPMDRAYETPRRECRRCAKREQWLPGYGGSEIGCWTPAASEPKARVEE